MSMSGSIDKWDWEGGVAMVGLMHAYEATKDEKILDYVESWVRARFAEGLSDPRLKEPICDIDQWADTARFSHPNHAAPAWATLMLYQYRPQPEYYKIVEQYVDFLIKYACRVEGEENHIRDEPWTEGAIGHIPNQIWDDTLAMTIPLLARYGAMFDQPEIIDIAVNEALAHARYLQDPKTGLWYHGWNSETQDNMAGAFWGRGNGWVVISMIDLLEWIPEDHYKRAQIMKTLNLQLAGLLRVQHKNGLWHTVVTRPDFYLETSGSSAVTAGLLYAQSKNWQNGDFQPYAQKALQAVYKKVSSDGSVTDVSAGTGGNAKSIDIYNNIPHNEIRPFGQGIFLIMASKK
jgi:unsaturated rhamnogalacturonyl hydrolase